MKITVTQEDIDKAQAIPSIKRDGSNCPVALAMAKLFPGASIWVSTGYILVDKERYEISESTKDFIKWFDRGAKTALQPSTLEIWPRLP